MPGSRRNECPDRAEYAAAATANPNAFQATLYEAIKKAITEIVSSEHLVFQHQYSLKDDLAGIFRIKIMKRYRLFYIASSAKGAARVLHIGYRKEGDKNDAYKDFGRRLSNGEFDIAFAELDLKKP